MRRKPLKVHGAYGRFTDEMLRLGWQRIGFEYVLPPDARDYKPIAEIHLWTGPSARLAAVQVWEDGSFQHYLPGQEGRIKSAAREIAQFDREIAKHTPDLDPPGSDAERAQVIAERDEPETYDGGLT